MTTYTPAPGTVAFRVIGWLEEQGATKEFNASQMANALDLDPKTITTCLQNALDTGLVFRRQKDRSHPRAPFWYSLTNHGVLQRAWTPNPVDWMRQPADVPVFREGGRTEPLRMADAGSGVGVSAPMTTPSPAVTNLPGHPNPPKGDQPRSERGREGMEPAVCESADGRGTTGAPALATLPQHASPGVGPMGAGQPADAGPTMGEGCGYFEQPREVGAQFAATIDKALQPQHVVAATFTLRCAGTLDIRADDLVLRLNDEQVGRLRRLLGAAG